VTGFAGSHDSILECDIRIRRCRRCGCCIVWLFVTNGSWSSSNGTGCQDMEGMWS